MSWGVAVDEHGCEGGVVGWDFQGIISGQDVRAWTATTFPRRSRIVSLRLYDSRPFAAEFPARNPFRRAHPVHDVCRRRVSIDPLLHEHDVGGHGFLVEDGASEADAFLDELPMGNGVLFLQRGIHRGDFDADAKAGTEILDDRQISSRRPEIVENEDEVVMLHQ